MARDAFGREQNEDPLADMGWKQAGSAPVGETSPEVAPPAPPIESGRPIESGPPTRPVFVRRDGGTPTPASLAPLLTQVRDAAAAAAGLPRPRRRRGGGVSLVVLLTLGAGTLGLFGLGSAVDSTTSEERAVPAPGFDDPGAAPDPGEANGGSLLRPTRVRRALAVARKDGRLQTLRVAPERIDATVVDSQRRMRILLIYPNGTVNRLGSATVPRSSIESIPWSTVDAAAPQRIARAAARDAGRSVRAVDYLVTINVGATPRWELFFKDGLHYRANVNGRAVRRVG
jgi:hypothetical protein